MSSSSFSEKEPLLISKIPIIGPFFRNIADSQSSSKLLVWLEIHKNKN
jgi:type II secretory pathway component GspD/PulD (secretin)